MPEKRNVGLMYVIGCLQGMIFYGPIATLYRQAAGVSVFEITVIESISLVLALALELPWGLVADRIGYRRTMILSCCVYFFSKLVFWRASGFGGFLAERVLLSVAVSGLSGVDTSILYLSCGEGKFQTVLGKYNNLCMVGLMFAAGIYSAFVGADYRLAALLTAVSYGAALLLAFGLKEVRKKDEAPRDRRGELRALLRRTLRSRRLLFLLLGAAFLTETHQIITVFLNQLQYTRAGLSDRAIALVYIAMTLCSLTGGLSARFTRRLGTERAGVSLFALCAAACLALALTQNALLSVAAVLALRVGYSLFEPLQMELQNREIDTDDRATALSLNTLLMDSAAVGINLVFGKAAQFDLRAAMAFGCALCAAGLVLYAVRGRGKTARSDS